MNKTEIATIIRPLSPTAARVLLVLYLGNGQSFTGKDLAQMLGKSANTISTAVNELEFFGLAQNNGRQYGWSLPAAKQMALPGEIQKFLEFQKNLDQFPSSFYIEENENEGSENKRNTAEFQKNLEQIKSSLIAAGIGANSKKMREILESGHDPEFVARHLHVWHHANEPVSYLITRLVDGSQPPKCKCPECAGTIPAEYADIIKR